MMHPRLLKTTTTSSNIIWSLFQTKIPHYNTDKPIIDITFFVAHHKYAQT